jgi:hypothetical protein
MPLRLALLLAFASACNGTTDPDVDTDATPTPEPIDTFDTPEVPGCGTLSFETDVVPSFAVAPAWNDWADAQNQTNACTPGTESCDDCVHGGEFRTVTVLTTCSCDDISFSDSLNALSWSCTEPGGGRLELNAAGFRPGKGLGDLIDPAGPAWRPMSMHVEHDEAEADTEPAAWWTNPVEAATGTLDSPGTIYVAASDVGAPLELAADGTALVIPPDVTQTGGASTAVVRASGVDRVWVEGSIDASDDTVGVDLDGVALGVVHRASVTGSEIAGIRLVDATVGRVANVSVDGGGYGISMSGAHGTCVRGGIARDSGEAGVRVADSDDVRVALIALVGSRNWGLDVQGGTRVRARAVRVAHTENGGVRISGTNTAELSALRIGNVGGWGMEIEDDAIRPVIVDATVAGNEDGGIRVRAADAVVAQVTAVGNGGPGIEIRGDSAVLMSAASLANQDGFDLRGDATTIVDVAAVDNSGAGVSVSGGGTIHGLVAVGDNGGDDCSGNVFGGGCSNAGGSTASYTTGASGASSHTGPVAIDDPANGSDDDGTSPYNGIDDWALFENDQRGWMEAVTFSFAGDTRCINGETCRIWDWSLRPDDTVLLAVRRAHDGDDALSHTWSAGNEDDCLETPGATWSGGTCTAEFLPAAVETLDDAFGNDNGLCEDFDSCFFSRNLASYQGQGRLRVVGGWVDGAIEGVTLREFRNNGRPPAVP